MTTAETSTESTIPSVNWHGNLYAEALRTGQGPLFLRRSDGWMLPLDIERWCGDVDRADQQVLDRCRGAVLDIGCGPGRFVTALRRQRRPVLGIDISLAAVQRTRDSGARALNLSVYDRLPGEGRWETGLLMDGNIGIGGDPKALLERTAEIIRPGGLLLAEVAAVDVDERIIVHVEDGRGERGDRFAWARLGMEALAQVVTATDWRIEERWTVAGRCFVGLRSRRLAGPVT